MSMMALQILKFVDLSKTQKTKYLENKMLFFLQIKKFVDYLLRFVLWQKIIF